MTQQDETPFVCNLNAMTADQRARYEALLAHLRESLIGMDLIDMPTREGVLFHLPNDDALWLAAAEFALLERLCCPFLDFELRLSAAGTLTFQLSGRHGVGEFLRHELGF